MLSVTDNVSVTQLPLYRGVRGLDRRRMRRDSRELTRRHLVRPVSPDAAVSELSGGNAQKVLMAKWLRSRPRLLLLEEPTQGVDVGARGQIERTILAAAADGASVLLSSADPDQLASLCHRVLVMSTGRVVQTLRDESLTKHHIAKACLDAAAPEDHTSVEAS
jgi:ribose transport system ATP-binding protein